MSFTLVDLGDATHSREVNAWNWRPTLALIAHARIIDAERIAMMGWNCTGVQVARDEARAIAAYVDSKIMPGIQSGQGVKYDLRVAPAPDDGRFFREGLEDNYQANAVWLATFAMFCRTCQGFGVE